MSKGEPKKVLIIAAHRPDRSPSQRYRFEQYLPYLSEHGFVFKWSPLLSAREDRVFYGHGGVVRKAFILLKGFWRRWRDMRHAKKFDLIFIQREAHFLGTSMIEKKFAKSGVPVIFDFDDSIWLADTSPGNLRWEWMKKPSKFYENVKMSTLAIAGNMYLAEQARKVQSNTIVIPTTVNTELHVPMPWLRNTRPVVIGWSGSISTVKHFEMLLPVLLELQQEFGDAIEIRLLGAATYRHEKLNPVTVAWSPALEVESLNRFDIGVMPLPDDQWSNGKCGLKALTYMACGIPAVVSPVGVNKEIIENGVNGYLASSNEDWLETLRMLIRSKQVREQIGTAGRETVVKKYSVEAWKNTYLEAFTRTAGS